VVNKRLRTVEIGGVARASSGGAKRACPPLEIGTKNQIFLENLNLATTFQLINLIVAMAVYLPV